MVEVDDLKRAAVERSAVRPAGDMPQVARLHEEVHVWTINLDHPDRNESSLIGVLCEEERERARRFRFDEHRRRFVCCRGTLRMVLAHYLNCSPEEFRFDYGHHGKPSVEGLHFNVAHSGDLAVIAVTRAGEVGVDVEAVRWLNDFDELVNRFFCPRESKVFAGLPKEIKPTAFFNLWTRKEALLKATGEGIAFSLNRVDVTFLPGEPVCLLSMPEEDSLKCWTLKELAPATGFIGALAIKKPQIQLKFWRL